MDPKFSLKRSHSEVSDISQSEEESESIENHKLPKLFSNKKNDKFTFPRFIILESIEEKKITQLSPFIIERVISANLNPKSVKKLKNDTILIEVEVKKHADFLLKMKNFHSIKIKAYPHKTLNTSKGVIRSPELSLCSIDEIKEELKDQGVIDIKRISIRREEHQIQTNTYIMTFDSPNIPQKIKIGYNSEKVNQYVPNPLRCYNCQKFGHHENKCNRRAICGRCGQTDADHSTKECKNNSKCANCGEDHPAYSRTCQKWKKEKEIMTVKYTRNLPYPEARKIVESYMKNSTYAEKAKTNNANQQNKMSEEHLKLIEKLIKLNQQEWTIFQHNLKETYSISGSEKNTNKPNTKVLNTSITKPTVQSTQIQEISKKVSKEIATNKEYTRNHNTQSITTQNKFQILEKMESDNIIEENIKKTTNKKKQDKPDGSETIPKPQPKIRSTSTSRSRTKEKDSQQNFQTKAKLTVPLEMEDENEKRKNRSSPKKIQQKTKNKNLGENKPTKPEEMEVETDLQNSIKGSKNTQS